MLSAYAAMARTQIESHGGVVEKFIGDAVVGIFGVPAAHEDDPERAVRAGLRIMRGRRGSRSDRRSTAPSAGRYQHRGDPRSHRDHPGLGRTPARRGRDQHRLTDPVGGARHGRGGGSRHLRGHRSGLRLRGAGARDAQGQVGAGAGLPREEPARSVRHRPHPHPRHPVHRSRDRPGAPQGHLRQDGGRELAPARHRGRASPVSARAGSSPSSAPTSTPNPSSSPGARVGACPTARASRSGRSGRS